MPQAVMRPLVMHRRATLLHAILLHVIHRHAIHLRVTRPRVMLRHNFVLNLLS
jgi:hypothetical protein